jgi:uncharacterized membrane protein
MATKADNKGTQNTDDRVWFIIAYVLTIITGILTLIVKGETDKRLKLHAMQAIFLGIAMIIVAIVFDLLFFIGFFGIIGSLINLLLWLYGLYVGFEAYNGRDVEIPVISDYARRYSGYSSSKK